MPLKKPLKDEQGRYWCFTINNYSEADTSRVETLLGGEATYIVAGYEVGPTDGTPHIQGYVEFEGNKRGRAVALLFGGRAHVERRRSTQANCVEYCKKDGRFVEFGTPTKGVGRGTRTDLQEVKLAIDGGRSEAAIASEYFNQWVIYRRSFESYRTLISKKPGFRPDLRVIVFWGATGTGKTRMARQLSLELHSNFWISQNPALTWFDGYKGEESVIIDDFRGESPFTWLLRVLDIYELSVPVKGGFVDWTPGYIFITSNLRVTEWYPKLDTAPLRRRVFKEVFFDQHVKPDWDDTHTSVLNELAFE
jgi:hypothetical protein